MTRFWGRVLVLTLVSLGGGPASLALAQGNIFNPYGNSGYADYRGFGSTKFSNDASLPGQARISSGDYATGNRYNQLEQFSNSLDGTDSTTGRGATNLPYYRAYQLSEASKRTYRPGDTAADRLYKARVAERNAAYQKAIGTKDPRERARLLRALDQDTINRPLAAIGRQPAAVDPASRSALNQARATAPAATARTQPATRPVATQPPSATAPRSATPTPPATPAPEPAAILPESVPVSPPSPR